MLEAVSRSQHHKLPVSVTNKHRVILESSRRLSSRISLHVFFTSAGCLDLFQPSGHIELQFPPDLDPTYGSGLSTESNRLLSFTPCHLRDDAPGTGHRISILTRNGRVTQLLGLPRLNGPLTAEVAGVGGGFSQQALKNYEKTTCIASATGIAPFLALACQDRRTRDAHLLCTLNGNDFEAIEFVLNSRMLVPEDWLAVGFFLTVGSEAPGLIAGKTVDWWEAKLAGLGKQLRDKVYFSCRRMTKKDIHATVSGSEHKVLFCGSKTLEWQVRMWVLDEMPVYTTAVE